MVQSQKLEHSESHVQYVGTELDAWYVAIIKT